MHHRSLDEYSETLMGMLSFRVAIGYMLMMTVLWLHYLNNFGYIEQDHDKEIILGEQDIYSIETKCTSYLYAKYRAPGHVSTNIA